MQKVEITATEKSRLEKTSKCKDYAGIPKALAEQLGLCRNQHVRIENPPYATYYRIKKIAEGSASFEVHEQSLDRFEGSDELEVTLSTTIPKENTRKEAKSNGGVHEELKDDGEQDNILIIAPHGGSIEPYTRKLADKTYEILRDANLSASLWKLHGYRHPEQEISSFRVWHFSKIMRSPQSYPKLQQIIDRNYSYVVGYHRSAYSHVEVGGKAGQELRKEIAERLRQQTGRKVRTDTSAMRLPGTAGIVSENYLSDSNNQAVHIECTKGICEHKQEEGARAVAEVLRNRIAAGTA